MNTSKKFIVSILMFALFISATVGCGSKEPQKEISSETIISTLQDKVSSVGETIIYTEDTDTNELLGRPKQYIGKADFEDTRAEQSGEYLVGGTVEIFSSEADCNSRWEYLEAFDDASLGAFGLNQYVYKYKTVLLRVDNCLTTSQAEEYRDAVNDYLGEKPTQNY